MCGLSVRQSSGETGLVLLLVPSDPLNFRIPDEHFAPEAAAAVGLGWDVARIDHDLLTMGHAGEAVSRLGAYTGSAVYRGWMLRSEEYAAAVQALQDRSV